MRATTHIEPSSWDTAARQGRSQTIVDKKHELGLANEWPYGRARTLWWLAKAEHIADICHPRRWAPFIEKTPENSVILDTMVTLLISAVFSKDNFCCKFAHFCVKVLGLLLRWCKKRERQISCMAEQLSMVSTYNHPNFREASKKRSCNWLGVLGQFLHC